MTSIRLSALSLVCLSVACSSEERTEDRILTLHVTGGACPGPAEAKPALMEVWPGTRIDGMHCDLEELQSVEEPTAADGESCCFPFSCNHELTPKESEALYRATCVGVSCENVSAEYKSSRAKAENAVVETKLDCTLDAASVGPVDTPSVQCSYRVTGVYSCSTAPG